MEERRQRLQARVIGMKMTPDLIERNFSYLETDDQWTKQKPMG